MLGSACLRDRRRRHADARSALSDSGSDLALNKRALTLTLAGSAGWMGGWRRGRVITITRAPAWPISSHGRAAVAHASGEGRGGGSSSASLLVLNRILVDGVRVVGVCGHAAPTDTEARSAVLGRAGKAERGDGKPSALRVIAGLTGERLPGRAGWRASLEEVGESSLSDGAASVARVWVVAITVAVNTATVLRAVSGHDCGESASSKCRCSVGFVAKMV